MGYKINDPKGSSLYDRVKKLLVSYEWSDCCFSVSGKIFNAHRLIMGISSPVFEAMLYGPLSNNTVITITDIEQDTFQQLLNYIYTDKVEISSFEKAYELLYAANKYMLEHLGEICIAYVQEHISIDNVTTILNYPDFMQDKVITCALKLFCEHANYLLQENRNFMSLSCMKIILESEHMNIIEQNLIKYVFDWTIQYCEQHNIDKTFENRRDVLISNGLFKLLRFSTLSTYELNEIVTGQNNLLLPDEVEIIIKAITNPTDIDKGTSVDSLDSTPIRRGSLKLQCHLCHRRPLKSVAPVIIDSNNFMIPVRLKANRSVFITSLCVPTRMTPIQNFGNASKTYTEQIAISVVSESDNSIVKFTNFMNTVQYDSMISIDLPEPIFIKQDNWYKITFAWPCNVYVTYSYVVEYRESIYKGHQITFEFDDLVLFGRKGSFFSGLNYCL